MQKKYVICDIDGCIALNDHRSHLIPQGDARNDTAAWRDFVMACSGDTVNEVIADLVRGLHAAGYEIIMATGRMYSARHQTINWLKANAIPYTALVCRNDDDHRTNALVKRDMLSGCVQMKQCYPVMAIEDDPDTVAMYRDKNVNTLAVAAKSSCLAN